RQFGRPIVRIPRTAGRPAVQTVELVDGTIRWRYSHSEGALPMLQLGLVQKGLFTPVESLDPCDRSAPVRLTRFGGADDVLVLANDGWNAVVRGGTLERPFKNATPVVLRQLEDGRFWADVPDGWAVRWSLDGVFQGTGLTLALAPSVLGR